jgi:hypothetical protein
MFDTKKYYIENKERKKKYYIENREKKRNIISRIEKEYQKELKRIGRITPKNLENGVGNITGITLKK